MLFELRVMFAALDCRVKAAFHAYPPVWSVSPQLAALDTAGYQTGSPAAEHRSSTRQAHIW
jgi:hypothetical protein